ncbi:MAG TPA: hypothetical protein VIH95_06410 [Acidimicrobiales bacterium]
MAPPPPAPATARRATAAPQARPTTRRPPLRVFQPEPRRSSRRGLSRRGHLWLAVALVVGSLLVVVIGDTLVAQGQVRMAAIQTSIGNQLTAQKAAQTEVAKLAAPDRVVAQGILLGLTAPAKVVDLPEVPLNVPLPVPDTSPAVSSAPTKPIASTTSQTAAAATPASPAVSTTTATTAPPTR